MNETVPGVVRFSSLLKSAPILLWSGSLILIILSLVQSHTTALPISALGLVRSLSLYYWSGLGVLIAGYVVALQYSAQDSRMLIVFPITVGVYLIGIPQLIPGIVYFLDVPGHFAGSLYIAATGQIQVQGTSEFVAYPASYVWGAALEEVIGAGGLAIPKMFPFLAVIALGACSFSLAGRVLGSTKFASVATCVFMILLMTQQDYLWFSPDFYGFIILAVFILSLGRSGVKGEQALAIFVLGIGGLLSDPGINLVILIYVSILLLGAVLLNQRTEYMAINLFIIAFGAVYDFLHVAVQGSWSLLTYIVTASSEALSIFSLNRGRYSNPNPTFGLATDLYTVISLGQLAISCVVALVLLRRRKQMTPLDFCIFGLFVCEFAISIVGITSTFAPRILEYLPLSSVPLGAIGIWRFGLAKRRPSIPLRALLVGLISCAIVVSLFVGYSTASYQSYSGSQLSSMEYVVTYSSNISNSTVDNHLGLYAAVLAGGTGSFLTAVNTPTFPDLGTYSNSSMVCLQLSCASGGLPDAIGGLSEFAVIVVGGEQAPAEWTLRYSMNGAGTMAAVEQKFDAVRDRVGVFGGAYPSVVYA